MASDPVDCPSQSAPRRHSTAVSLCVVLTLAAVLLGDPGSAAAQPTSRLDLFRIQHAQLRKDHLAALDKIRAFCAAQKLDEGVRAVEAAIGLATTKPATSLQLPVQVAADLSPDLPAPERQWQSQLRTQRRKHAQALFVLSRRVLKARYTSFAYDLVRETTVSDPDLRPARLLLGFVRSGNRWVTPFAAKQLGRRHVWHSKFGWLPASHVEKYESGQRYFKRHWVSLEREAELRREFRNAWEVRTDHFLVRTNHSLEKGVALAESLETFYRFFHSSFAGFFKTPEQIQKLFDGTNRVNGRSRTPPRPHVVHFYRDSSCQSSRTQLRETGKSSSTRLSMVAESFTETDCLPDKVTASGPRRIGFQFAAFGPPSGRVRPDRVLITSRAVGPLRCSRPPNFSA